MCVVDADLKFAVIAAMECEVGPRGGGVVEATVFAVILVGATGRPPPPHVHKPLATFHLTQKNVFHFVLI
jgi:hypothetical protein